MPVKGLYLCGSGAHPGGGVTGVPGMNAAREIAKDLNHRRIDDGEGEMKFGSIVPLLRMFDIPATRAFYIDYLGFSVDFEHRFEPELPLYMQVSRGACRLHLTQHHGDCCPGAPFASTAMMFSGCTRN